jgi:hypothetical protein
MIEIGTVLEKFADGDKEMKKVRIGWEFPNDLKVFNPEKGEQPITVDEEYTLSTGDKANLRKMLASWRGKDFSPEEAKCFDITKVLGAGCMVTVIHVQSKSDATKIYSKIGSVSSLPKGTVLPPQINETFLLEYDNFDVAKFNSLPDFIKEKMRTSKEFKALQQEHSQEVPTQVVDGIPAPARNSDGTLVTQVNTIDDLPF